MRLLIICYGNINRSAAVAAILKKDFPRHEVVSRGFVNPNRRAAKKMRDAMAKRGYDLEEHRSRLVTETDVAWADRIVIMDNPNHKRFRELFGDSPKLRRLGHWHEPKLNRIPDPGYMAKASPEFAEVVELIHQCTQQLGVDP